MPSGAEFTRDERQLNQHENPNDAMSDDNSHSSDTVNSKKGFFSLLLSQLFHGEPKNRDELLALIRDSGQNDLIDEDTRDMLEGVMDIADQRVRDIMIPRSQMITLKRNQTLDECLDVIIESAHSRFPVISEDKDHIEGILMARDLAAVYAQRRRSLQHGKSVTAGGCRPGKQAGRPHAERVSLTALPHGDRY